MPTTLEASNSPNTNGTQEAAHSLSLDQLQKNSHALYCSGAQVHRPEELNVDCHFFNCYMILYAEVA